MGSLISRISFAIHILKELYDSYAKLTKRFDASPGLPVPNPTKSYWMHPPSAIAQHGSSADTRLPEYADVVIIGSGIAGTSVARTLLDRYEETSDGPLKVVMLDARDACSGATGRCVWDIYLSIHIQFTLLFRNGGHINAPSYHDYASLKKEFGIAEAQKVIRFRLAHLPNLTSIASEERISTYSQCRNVDLLNVYMDKTFYEETKKKLELYIADFPPEEIGSFKIIEDKEELTARASCVCFLADIRRFSFHCLPEAADFPVGGRMYCSAWWRNPPISPSNRYLV